MSYGRIDNNAKWAVAKWIIIQSELTGRMDKIVKWAVAEWIIIQSELTGRMDKIAKWAVAEWTTMQSELWQNGQQCKVSCGKMDNNTKWADLQNG